MKKWPVPDSYTKNLPEENSNGGFWKFRGDRYHCGIDIYAPVRSKVLAVDGGKVVDTGIFTSPEMIYYWNKTYYIVIEHSGGLICRYAEMGGITVEKEESIKAGQLLGYVGEVINVGKVTEESPNYVMELKNNGRQSMLHLELYDGYPLLKDEYLGGNLFRNDKPENLLDPTTYLSTTIKSN